MGADDFFTADTAAAADPAQVYAMDPATAQAFAVDPAAAQSGVLTGDLSAAGPIPPPAMPTAMPGAVPAPVAVPPAMPNQVVAAPAAPPTTGAGWAIDPDRLRSFSDAVTRARSYLDAVQMKVNQMQGAELTPQLGTSSVGRQLAKKFDDRLNATEGLRGMLEEAMARMQKFVASAEAAARTYEDMDETERASFDGILPDTGGILTDVLDGIMRRRRRVGHRPAGHARRPLRRPARRL